MPQVEYDLPMAKVGKRPKKSGRRKIGSTKRLKRSKRYKKRKR